MEIEELTASNKDFYDKAVKFRETLQKAETLEEKKKLHDENMTNLKATMTPLKGEAKWRKREREKTKDSRMLMTTCFLLRDGERAKEPQRQLP